MKKKVLVVDDEIHIVQVVAIKLKNNGYDVITAQDGLSAHKIACEELPDAIITDWQMPGMTGIELIAELKKNDATAHIPVIVLTAHGFSVEYDKNQCLDAADCLSKPFSPRELLEKLDSLFAEVAV